MPTNASFQIINFALFCTRNMAANCVRFGLLRAVEKPQPLFFNAPTDLIKKKKYIYRHHERFLPPFFLAWLFVTLSISRRYFARFSCFYQRAPLRNFSELCLQTNCSKYCENKITSRLQHIKKIIFLIISLTSKIYLENIRVYWIILCLKKHYSTMLASI